jgi:hypothetical protein
MLALHDRIAPPTLNLVNPDAAAKGIDLDAGTARRVPIEHAISDGFSFGGINAGNIFDAGRAQCDPRLQQDAGAFPFSATIGTTSNLSQCRRTPPLCHRHSCFCPESNVSNDGR